MHAAGKGHSIMFSTTKRPYPICNASSHFLNGRYEAFGKENLRKNHEYGKRMTVVIAIKKRLKKTAND